MQPSSVSLLSCVEPNGNAILSTTIAASLNTLAFRLCSRSRIEADGRHYQPYKFLLLVCLNKNTIHPNSHISKPRVFGNNNN